MYLLVSVFVARNSICQGILLLGAELCRGPLLLTFVAGLFVCSGLQTPGLSKVGAGLLQT